MSSMIPSVMARVTSYAEGFHKQPLAPSASIAALAGLAVSHILPLLSAVGGIAFGGSLVVANRILERQTEIQNPSIRIALAAAIALTVVLISAKLALFLSIVGCGYELLIEKAGLREKLREQLQHLASKKPQEAPGKALLQEESKDSQVPISEQARYFAMGSLQTLLTHLDWAAQDRADRVNPPAASST
jgi:ABC-type multidrug transport system fused ATPase/permease subunit